MWSGQAPAQTQTKPVTHGAGASWHADGGQTLYEPTAQSCHGVGGVGAQGPELLNVGLPRRWTSSFRPGACRSASPDGSSRSRTSPTSTRAQIADIVAYVNALDVGPRDAGAGIPPWSRRLQHGDGQCPTLSEGNQLFMLNCAQCHDASGRRRDAQPRLRGAEPPPGHAGTDRRGRSGSGLGRCPISVPGELSNQQVSAIADYVSYISHTLVQGGLGIANFGPVPEGFVGIIFGLGALLVAPA